MASKTAQDYLPTDSVFKYMVILQSLTQSGTSAPTGTLRKNETAATTITLGRTGVGVYTLTADAAVFTAGKTDVIVPAPGNGRHVFDVDFTSTSQITITTGVLTYTLGVVATPTDAILDGRTFEIRIHD